MISLPSVALAHDYQRFSEQYSRLRIEGTYYLAFNAALELIQRHRGLGKRALDFGCGTGRSTRFLQDLGFNVIGVDKDPAMLKQARQNSGRYRLLRSEKLPFMRSRFDLIFQSFVLLEYASLAQMVDTFKELNRTLARDGRVIVVTGSEDYYRHNWYSFQLDCAANQELKSGEKARVAIRDTNIVLFDYYWTNNNYQDVFQESGFEAIETLQPLAQGNEPFDWVSECKFPCWTIYVLKKRARM